MRIKKSIHLIILIFCMISGQVHALDKKQFVIDITNAKNIANTSGIEKGISAWLSKSKLYGNIDGRYEYELGVLYTLAKEYIKAEEVFKKGIKITNKYPRLYTGLSVAYLQQEKLEDASTWANKATSDYPNWPVGYAVMGNIEFHKSNYEKSIEHAIKSLKLKESSLAYYVYGASSYYLEDYKTTAITINRAIKLDQTYLSEKEAMLMLAYSLAKIGEFQHAYATLDALVKYNANISKEHINGNIQEIMKLEKAHNN